SREDQPIEFRGKVTKQTIAEVRRLSGDAVQGFNTWANETEAKAKRAYRADPVGSAADESRRVANELRIARLVETAERADARTGPQIIDGRPVSNPTAYALARQAHDAWMDGNYTDAQAFASASTALGGPETAQQTFQL